tara:strand:- start:451 stop:678 length:228 start_codon:yes stop_codon:yes gene_type:complete
MKIRYGAPLADIMHDALEGGCGIEDDTMTEAFRLVVEQSTEDVMYSAIVRYVPSECVEELIIALEQRLAKMEDSD